jgi:hypothetical protein
MGLDDKNSKERDVLASGLLAGFAKTFLGNIASSALFMFKGIVTWWFRLPIKLFRPSSINPWSIFQQIALAENKSLSPIFIRNILKREGFHMVKTSVLPLMTVNALLGGVLFNVYSFSLNLFNDLRGRQFLSGFNAGLIYAILSTPVERIQNQITKDVSRHNKNATIKLFKIPTGFKERIRYYYKNIKYNAARYYCADC